MKSVKRILLVLSMLLTVTLFAGCATKEADKTNDHTDTDVAQSDVIMAKTENYTLSESEMKVLEYQFFNNVYYSLYYCAMYYNYGLTDYVNTYYGDYYFSDISSYSGNPQGYAEAHFGNYDIEGMAYTMAEYMLVYNEGADREGYKADADELAEAKKNVGYIAIDTFKSGAEENSMTLGAYIRSCIGDGVSKGDVEKVIDLYARYSLFIEDKSESVKDAVTLEEAEKYRDDNKDQFYYTEYVYCELPDEDWITAEVRSQAAACKTLDELKELLDAAKSDDSADDEEEHEGSISVDEGLISIDEGLAAVGKIDGVIVSQVTGIISSGAYVVEQYEDRDILIWDVSDAPMTTVFAHPTSDSIDAFHRYLARKNATDESEEETSKSSATGHVADDSKGIGNSDETETIYLFVIMEDGHITVSGTPGGSTITGSIGTAIGSSGNGNTETEKNYELEESFKCSVLFPGEDGETIDDMTKWLFEPGRQAGDVTVLKRGSTYYWVRIPEGAKINGYNDEKTKVGYYAILKDDTTNEEDAESTIYTKDDKFALIEEANDLSARRDVFESILQTGEKMAITEDDLKEIGDELAEWFYSGDRREGDYARITVGEGDDAKEYAVLFVEENEETWMTSARYYKAQEDLTAWFDAMKVTCGYTENHENS